MDQVFTLTPLWNRVWARRGAIASIVLAGTLAVGVVAFLLPPWYRASAELLPPTEEEGGLGLATLLRGVGVPGVKIPTEISLADVFIVVLGSQRVGTQMVERFDLKKLYKCKYTTDAIKQLRRHSRFKVTAAGSIQISVEDRSATRSAEMTNAFVEFLDRFNREVRTTKGRRTRLFIGERLNEIKQELALAEQRLALYQAKNKAVAFSPQTSSAIDEAAKLYARRMALRVRLGVVRGYSDGSQEEIQIQQELTQIDQQMRELPETGLELTRLLRDVRALEQVFTILTAQHEDARITEARDLLTVDVLDEAKPPDRKARPRRGLMMAAAFLLSLALGVGYAAIERDKRPERLQAVVGE